MRWCTKQLTSLASCLGALQIACVAAVELVRHDTTWQPHYVLNATEENIKIDCEDRVSTVFNGSFPGPTIYLREGEVTWIRVYNNVPDANLTVHWHGLTMRTAPFSDGTPLVSQWPIGSNRYFDYEIRPEVGDAGTYFYHSHVGFQAVTAQGLLIVESANETKPAYEYDDEFPLVFGDYFPKPDHELETGLEGYPFQWSGEAKAMLMNGHSGATPFNGSDPSCHPHVVKVKPGKTYRVRFVGGTGLSSVITAFEGHSSLTIIEADGQWTKEAETDHIQLGSGQRFSALLKTKTKEELGDKRSYWIRYDSHDRPNTTTSYGLLVYVDKDQDVLEGPMPSTLPAPDSPPVKLSHEQADYAGWLEYKLSPHESLSGKESFPERKDVTRTVYVHVNQQRLDQAYQPTIDNSSRVVWSSNSLTWGESRMAGKDLIPYMVQAYNGSRVPDYKAALHNDGWDAKTSAFPALVGEVLEIVWVSNSGHSGNWETHPIHAHGAHFWDLGSGDGLYDPGENDGRFADGYVPARRDTTQLYTYQRHGETGTPHTDRGWRAWRLRVTEDNVGAWMMHCHITPHTVMGMSTVWVFGTAQQISDRVPQPYVSGYLEFDGSAYGRESGFPEVAHFFNETSR